MIMDMADADEATVETVEDEIIVEDGEPDRYHRQQQQGQPSPGSMMWINPWYVVLLAVILYVIYNRYRDQIEARLAEWKRRREEHAEVAAIKKNPDIYRSKMEAMERARRAMQDRYDGQAAAFAERERVREEEKQRERAQELENLMSGKGYRNKVKVEEAQFGDGVRRSEGEQDKAKKKKPQFRPEYNPLMGGGGSSGYRPARRSNQRGG